MACNLACEVQAVARQEVNNENRLVTERLDLHDK